MHAKLVTALGQVKGLQPKYDDILKDVVSAMHGNAWTGGTSAAFGSQLTSQNKAIHTATQDCIDNVQTALSNCPATVKNPAAKPK